MKKSDNGKYLVKQNYTYLNAELNITHIYNKIKILSF